VEVNSHHFVVKPIDVATTFENHYAPCYRNLRWILERYQINTWLSSFFYPNTLSEPVRTDQQALLESLKLIMVISH
jgi:hypothetical protein